MILNIYDIYTQKETLFLSWFFETIEHSSRVYLSNMKSNFQKKKDQINHFKILKDSHFWWHDEDNFTRLVYLSNKKSIWLKHKTLKNLHKTTQKIYKWKRNERSITVGVVE